MHNIFIYLFVLKLLMRKKTIDAALRSTWNSVSKMYNREASKFNSTMATGFALLNIEAKGTPPVHWVQNWEWNPQVCRDY